MASAMPDMFYPEDVKKLFSNKDVVFLGDSNVRALYKDLVQITLNKEFISKAHLRAKMEDSFLGDRLLYHGEKTNGRDYREERKFKCNQGSYQFFFITRVDSKYLDEIVRIINGKSTPHVVIISSCLWDVTRWGPNGVEEYKKNLPSVIKLFKKKLPKDCLIIWLTTPPITVNLTGGFLVKQLQFLQYSLRFHVMEANQFAHEMALKMKFDVVDLHYALRMLIHLRENDGIHWQPPAVRHCTNLILTHISRAWEVLLPHRFPPQAENGLVTMPKKTSKRKKKNQVQRGPYNKPIKPPINPHFKDFPAPERPQFVPPTSSAFQQATLFQMALERSQFVPPRHQVKLFQTVLAQYQVAVVENPVHSSKS